MHHSLTPFPDQIASVDGLLLVVTLPQASNTCFSTSTVDLLKESAQLFAKKKAIVLISTPYAMLKSSL
jgi:hypothetical protein